MKNNIKTYIIISSILILGIVLGSTLFSSESPKEDKHNHAQDQAEDSVWTCSMHPQIRKDEPGDCPICGMELIPASQMSDDIDPDAIRMSKSARALAQVETTIVGNQNMDSSLNLSGQLEINQNETQSISANFKARVEKLYINEEGEAVNKNQIIAELYAPEIQILKDELELATQQDNSNLLKSIEKKIENYELSISDVKSLKNGKLKLRSPKTGVISNLNIEQGDNVKANQNLMGIVDLSTLWAVVDIYESDLDKISVGDQLTIQTPNHQNISGQVSFISPVLESNSRSAKARIVVNNPNQNLKPGVFITAKLKNTKPKTSSNQKLMVPKSAVLWTGKRSVIYQQLENENGVYFKMKTVETGSSSSDYIEILSGLKSGDKIVTHGAFSIDSEAQLANKPSMMNPEGKTIKTGHQHGNMEMPKTNQSQSVEDDETLSQIVKNYIELKNTLVNDNFAASKKAYQNLISKFSNYSDTAFKSSKDFKSINDLRDSFIKISDEIISLVNTSNPMEKTIYVQQCPMANQSQGASWLSFSQEVKNPYYGASMLKCGSVIDSIP
ncbi:efflux RND transporter periplasmic adaptor subunit [Flavobacteriaceae bacterium 14752]|uniref:efflux RND transporter periplasmic adaptor subunit n=1 Tax=Mesohalobacter salilacus TaxID=2491711 RepID=UPI000F6449F1|nr:efflux RND transporter periplasmic adaptor subunit [Flavobacteriaceae bacterium 14752]